MYVVGIILFSIATMTYDDMGQVLGTAGRLYPGFFWERRITCLLEIFVKYVTFFYTI